MCVLGGYVHGDVYYGNDVADGTEVRGPIDWLAAQAIGVLGSTPGDCWPFHFPLFSPHNI